MRLMPLFLLLLSLSLQAAMIPMEGVFSEQEKTVDIETPKSAILHLKLEKEDRQSRFVIRDLYTNEELILKPGAYAIGPGEYRLILFRLDVLDEKPDPNFQTITETVTIEKDETISRTFPLAAERVIATWYDDWTIALTTGQLGADYEVSHLLKEQYDSQGISNSYPELDKVGNIGGSIASRTGIALGYKHLFAQSSWLAQIDLAWDQDADSFLTRTGIHLGAGKYWGHATTTPWISALVGQESATWNGISIDGTNSLSGSNSVTTLNLEVGLTYRPWNILLSGRYDLINQSFMAHLGISQTGSGER